MRRIRTAVHTAVHIALTIGVLAIVGETALAQTTAMTPSPSVAKRPPQPARTLLDEALREAKTTKRGVLTKFGASWCGPCHQLDAFVADTTGVGAIMAAHFVVVSLTVLESPAKVALENPGASELGQQYGWNTVSSGVPFFFMLSSAGKKLGDSNGMPNGGNIGYPETVAEVEAFNTLLTTTAPRMSAAERARIRQFLDRAAGRR